MPGVHDLLSEKGNEVWSIEPSQSVYQAINMSDDQLVGMISVGDTVKAILKEQEFKIE